MYAHKQTHFLHIFGLWPLVEIKNTKDRVCYNHAPLCHFLTSLTCWASSCLLNYHMYTCSFALIVMSSGFQMLNFYLHLMFLAFARKTEGIHKQLFKIEHQQWRKKRWTILIIDGSKKITTKLGWRVSYSSCDPKA